MQVTKKVVTSGNNSLSNLEKDLDDKPPEDASAQEVSAFTLAMVSALSTVEKVAQSVSSISKIYSH